MNVTEIIAKLKEFPPDADVLYHDDSQLLNVTEIRLVDEEVADVKQDLGKVLIW